MKETLLRVMATLYRKEGKEYYRLSEIYEEVERVTNKEIVNNGASIRRSLETFCGDSKAFSNKEELFSLKEKGTGLWRSAFYDNLVKINNLKIGDILTRNDLISIFRHSGMRGIDFSSRTYSLILVSNEEAEFYVDSIIENGTLVYTGEGLKGDQKLTGNNLTLASSSENELPVYLFIKDKNLKYHYQGEVVLNGDPYQVEENGRLVYKFPLRLKDYVEEDYSTFEGYSSVVDSVLKIEEDINVYNVGNVSLKFVDGPVNIRKYNANTEKRKSNRTRKPDYIADEIIKTVQGEITEKDVYEYEINKVMQYEIDGLVEEMKQFFENKKDNEGYDILSFDIDEDRNISKMYIEVKSTKGGESTPIDITSNELEYAKENMSNYYIYRVINSDSKNRYVKVIKGEELFSDFDMVPNSYRIYGK